MADKPTLTADAVNLSVLALDLSTRVGWSFGDPNTDPIYGVWKLGEGSLGFRCSKFAEHLEGAIQEYRPDLLILEAPLSGQYQSSNHVAQTQFGFAAVAQMIAHEWGMRCEETNAITENPVLDRIGLNGLINRIVREAGSQKTVASDLVISPQHLCDVLSGRRDLGGAVLARLGYRRVVRFEPIKMETDHE